MVPVKSDSVTPTQEHAATPDDHLSERAPKADAFVDNSTRSGSKPQQSSDGEAVRAKMFTLIRGQQSSFIDSDRDAVVRESEQFLRGLSEYKGAGFVPYLVRGVSSSFDAGHDQLGVVDSLFVNSVAGIDSHDKFSVYESNSPLTCMNLRNRAAQDLSPELRTGGSYMEIHALSLESKDIGDGKGRIRIYNHLNPRDPILYEKTVTLDAKGQVTKRDIDLIRKEFSAKYDDAESDLQAALRMVPSKRGWKPVISPDPGVPISEDTKNSLVNLVKAGYTVSAEFYPLGGERDRSTNGPGNELKRIDIDLTRDTLRMSKDHALEVHGDISRISLERTVDPSTIKPPLLSSEGHRFETLRDKFGNLISRALELSTVTNTVYETIQISPALPLSPSGRSEKQMLRVDLSAFGLGEFPAIFNREGLARLTAKERMNVYSNMPVAEVEASYLKHVPAMVRGSSDAEGLFGHSPRSKAQNIFLVNASSPNAFFSLANPTTIVVQDEILKDGKLSPDHIAFHETVHLLDGQSGWKLSGDEFESVFKEIKEKHPSFFELIDERRILPNASIGGHAAKDPKEFLASFMNSIYLAKINHGAWEQKIRSFTEADRVTYSHVLDVLERHFTDLETKGVIPHGAPVVEFIRECRRSFGE